MVNALAPAEVTKVVLDEEAGRVEVVVPDEQLSLAIGRRGQNVRLASQLTRWDIDILTEAEESETPPGRVSAAAPACSWKRWTWTMSSPACWSPRASTRSRNWPSSRSDELADIEGFDENVADELIRRAEAFLVRRDETLTEQRVALGVSDDVASFEFFTPQMLVTLGEKGVKTLDDLADLAGDELVEILGADLPWTRRVPTKSSWRRARIGSRVRRRREGKASERAAVLFLKKRTKKLLLPALPQHRSLMGEAGLAPAP